MATVAMCCIDLEVTCNLLEISDYKSLTKTIFFDDSETKVDPKGKSTNNNLISCLVECFESSLTDLLWRAAICVTHLFESVSDTEILSLLADEVDNIEDALKNYNEEEQRSRMGKVEIFMKTLIQTQISQSSECKKLLQ